MLNPKPVTAVWLCSGQNERNNEKRIKLRFSFFFNNGDLWAENNTDYNDRISIQQTLMWPGQSGKCQMFILLICTASHVPLQWTCNHKLHFAFRVDKTMWPESALAQLFLSFCLEFHEDYFPLCNSTVHWQLSWWWYDIAERSRTSYRWPWAIFGQLILTLL